MRLTLTCWCKMWWKTYHLFEGSKVEQISHLSWSKGVSNNKYNQTSKHVHRMTQRTFFGGWLKLQEKAEHFHVIWIPSAVLPVNSEWFVASIPMFFTLWFVTRCSRAGQHHRQWWRHSHGQLYSCQWRPLHGVREVCRPGGPTQVGAERWLLEILIPLVGM